GTVSYDIGSGAGNGTIVGSGLRIDQAGSYTLSATTASGLTEGDSSAFTVSATTASKLVFTTQPGGATAGSAFVTQPVVQTEDAYGNLSTVGLPSSEMVSIAIKTGTGTLQGTFSYDIGSGAGNGTITGSGLRIDQAGSYTLSATTASGLSEGDSSAFTVRATTASKLVFTTQPGGATAGSTFVTQPVVQTEDVYGNLSTVGLPSSEMVSIAIKTGTGTLQGTVSYDIGSGHGNGTITGSGLRIDQAGSYTLSATTASGLSEGDSSAFTVSATTASKLVITTTAQTLTAGSASSPITVQLEDPY